MCAQKEDLARDREVLGDDRRAWSELDRSPSALVVLTDAGSYALLGGTGSGGRDRLVGYGLRIRDVHAPGINRDHHGLVAGDAARAGQLRTVIHGIDLDAVRATADRSAVRTELRLPEDAFVFVCVANLRREKALDELVEAARRVVAGRADIHYVLVGQGPLAADLDRWIADAGVDVNVHAIGYRSDATRIVSAADAFTMSSHHEGLPVSVMEALALGLPVVATAAGGIPSAVLDAGVVTPIGDPTALADAQLRVATDDRLRQELAAHAATRADDFSIRRAVAEIEAVYDTVTS